jgi:outer membrane protein W
MKRLYLFVVPFFLIVGLSAVSWAEGRLPLQGSLGFGARVYGVFPKGDTFQPAGQPRQKLDFANEVGGEVNITYRFLKYLALEGGIGYTKIDVKNNTLGVNWATIQAVPISATLQFRWVSRKPEELKWIIPYACIGGGYYILGIEERSEFRSYSLSRGYGVNLEIDDAFFFHLGGGFDIFLTKNLAFNLEARYSWAEMDIDERQNVGGTYSRVGASVNLNAAIVGAGFKFYF